jgi:quercetin dioxygenase-like cupin family protein
MKNTKTSFMLSCCLIVSTFGASLKAQVKDEPKTEKKYTIDNCVTEFSMDKTEKTQVGYQFWFADRDFIDGRTLKMSVVAPHSATHPPHKHAEDEFFFVLEGTAEFYLDGKTKTAGPYTSFYCPSNVEHGIKNVGDTELKYLVIKKYEKK